MKQTIQSHLSILGIALSTALIPLSTFGQGTAFTYNGQFNVGTRPAEGTYDLRFALFDSAVAGVQKGPTLTSASTTIAGGVFTSVLDFGNEFPGASRWLEISVRTNGSINFTTLSPRQALTPTPYAITAGQLSGALSSANLNGTYSNPLVLDSSSNRFSGNGANLTGLNASQLTSGTVPDTRLSANVSLLGSSIESAEITDGTITPNDLNLGGFGTTFWRGTGNSGTTAGTHFLGTTDNQPLEFKVNGTRAWRLEPNDVSPNTIGGSSGNFISPSAHGSAIGGGGGTALSEPNQIRSSYGTIGGGSRNLIGFGADWSTVAGGLANFSGSSNTVVGGGRHDTIGFNAEHSAISGGNSNQIADLSAGATISGGQQNAIQDGATYATIGGGYQNLILPGGTYGVVPGGVQNTATTQSFAAGSRAKAVHPGSFVWGDSTPEDFSSSGSDQFSIRARGGIQIDPFTSLNFGSQVRQMLNLWRNLYGIGVQASTLYFRSDFNYAWYRGGVHNDAVGHPGGGVEMMRLTPGGLTVNGILASLSDRNAKENIDPVDSRAILEKVVALPVSNWNYKTDSATRHIGPMAQDFHAAFAVGEDDKHLNSVDTTGVALAAIQGLNAKVEELRGENAQLKARLQKLEEKLARWNPDNR